MKRSLIFLSLATLCACTALISAPEGKKSGSPQIVMARPPQPFYLTVINKTFAPVTVIANYSTFRNNLGSVNPGGSYTFGMSGSGLQKVTLISGLKIIQEITDVSGEKEITLS
jgi:hypothetical protein